MTKKKTSKEKMFTVLQHDDPIYDTPSLYLISKRLGKLYDSDNSYIDEKYHIDHLRKYLFWARNYAKNPKDSHLKAFEKIGLAISPYWQSDYHIKELYERNNIPLEKTLKDMRRFAKVYEALKKNKHVVVPSDSDKDTT